MVQLAHYTITAQIHQGVEAVLYRGYRSADRAPVILKLLKGDYPDVRALAKLRHEYALLKDLALPGVVKAYGLEKAGSSLALVLEDLGGEPLHALLKAKRLDLRTALRIAAASADALQSLHGCQIIHKDIKPQNIMVHSETRTVKLIDFSIATGLHRETQTATRPDALEGTLAYMSPEQTGRMNRALDSRTDLYSLGVTIYEMLTGALPFSSKDAMELVHSHIARKPAPPHELSAEIPPVVSAITMKLLSKAAEDRYQSAGGLKADLEECLARLTADGRIDPFPLGRHDRTGKLRLPQTLYGREEECMALASAWDRARKGAAELFLVSGYSGVGKSALIQEIHKLIARGAGHFIAGKFEQLGRAIPYAPVAHAFGELIHHILTEPPAALERWTQRLEDALGSNGQILIDLIPELELVIGPQPAVAELGPTESQNRFALVFQRFLHVFTTREHPIAIFVDDLQWADPASLRLIELLLTDPDRGCLLVLGAYRDSEVDRTHPLMLTLDGLRSAGTAVTEIELQPLSLPEVTRLIADVLGQSSPEVEPLAALVWAKTRGNPFFLNQFLGTLEQEKLLTWDARAGSFTWDTGRIAAQTVTDNVVHFIASKLQRMPDDTRRTLELAACMGHCFDLETLSTLADKPPASVAADLWGALREGLVLPLNTEYRFLHEAAEEGAEGAVDAQALKVCYRFMHDRVQQAAYSLVEESERRALHLRVGRVLLARATEDPRDEALFDMTNHLNLGAAGMTARGERTALARLNLAAGRKAKASAAYQAAVGYLRAGLSLLEDESWETDYELTFALHMERAECEFVTRALEAAESSFEVLLARARSSLDLSRVHQLRIVVYTAAGQFDRALAVGQEALSAAGIDLPEGAEACKAEAEAELSEVLANLAGRQVSDLLNAPLMTDPDRQATLKILVKLGGPAYLTDPGIYAFLVGKQVNFNLLHGHSDASPSSYAFYSLALYGLLGMYEEAYEFGKLALDLCEKFNAVEHRCMVSFLFACVTAFRKPLRSSLAYFEQAHHAGLESGDLVYLSYCTFHHLNVRLALGDDLRLLDEEADRSLSLAQRTRDPVAKGFLTISKQMALNLMGRTRSRSTLSNEAFDEPSFLSTLGDGSLVPVAAWYYTVKMELSALYGEYEDALTMALLADERSATVKGYHSETDRRFFTCLIYCALYPERAADEQAHYRAQLTRHQRKLAAWAESCPENFLHKDRLVRAERARVEGDELGAMNLYGEAIELARQNEFVHHEALANELSAKFHLARGRRKIAAMHMADARQGYLRWGATEKARHLAEKYPDLFVQAGASARDCAAETAESTTSGRAGALLDVGTITRAAQAIASEIVLGKVLDRLMRIVIENAGAQRGILLLVRDGRLMIEARITVDPDEVTVGPPVPVETSTDIALSVVHYVERTREPVVLGDAGRTSRFAGDPCMAARPPKSLLCLSMMHQGRLTGILYLENNAATDVFTPARLELCSVLSSHAAIAVENALLVARVQATSDALRRANEELEEGIARRTEELREANERLRLELCERERAEAERARLQEEIIRTQTERLSEMSTPLIPITDRIMVMPLIGTLDEARAQQMLEGSLRGAQARRAAVVILDITGVKIVDNAVAGMLMSTAAALRLLGAQAVLTGIRPEVAQTLVALNVDLGAIVTKATLQSGIAYALRRSGEA